MICSKHINTSRLKPRVKSSTLPITALKAHVYLGFAAAWRLSVLAQLEQLSLIACQHKQKQGADGNVKWLKLWSRIFAPVMWRMGEKKKLKNSIHVIEEGPLIFVIINFCSKVLYKNDWGGEYEHYLLLSARAYPELIFTLDHPLGSEKIPATSSSQKVKIIESWTATTNLIINNQKRQKQHLRCASQFKP